jgi:cytochrome c oxidase assembly factor CtaG
MLAVSLVGFAALYTIGMVRVWRSAGVGRGIRYSETLAFASGWLVLVAALLSPLDEWSETLFVAHMAQHELLMVVAAPLIALSSPLVAMLWAFPAPARYRFAHILKAPAVTSAWAALTAVPTVWMLHALALWIWHLPSLYDAALEHEGVHAVQHLCFFLTAALFWWGLVRGRYGRLGYGAAVVYLFATALHSGVLGALIAFAPEVWYPVYASNSRAWGLTPLEDQQLAGLLMWVPAGLVFAAGGLAFFAAWLRESGRRARFTSFVWLVVVALAAAGCRSQEQILADQEKALSSAYATTSAIGKAWLSGQVSTTYARTAIDQMRVLVAQQRTALAESPKLLIAPRGSELSQQEERLSRLLALLAQAIADGDQSGTRAHLAAIASPPHPQ